MHWPAHSKPQKANPLFALFKRKNQTSTSVPPQSIPNTKPSATGDSLDTKRTKARYVEADIILQKAVKECGHQWRSLNFTEVLGELDNVNHSQFKNKIDLVLEAYKDKLKDHTTLRKCGHAIQCCFTAFGPLAKNMLAIAKQGSAVFFII